MKVRTIFQKQIILYMGILLAFFGFFWAGISIVYTNQYMKEQEQQLIVQGERFQESITSLYMTGLFDTSRMSFELQVTENYMGASVFFMNSQGKVSLVSSSLNERWIGQTITDEAVNVVLDGKIATVRGRVGGMFNETVLTVGYPIVLGDNILVGGIFMCKPITVLQETAGEMQMIIAGCAVPAFVVGAVLIYISSKRISQPLRDMNETAKIIADGNFEKRLEVESADEVGQLAQSFNYMAESLETNENNRRKFISDICHDLRSPLTSIQGFISAMADGTIPVEKQGKYFQIVLEETARLSKLANDMTDLSKAEAGAIEVEKSVFDINELIEDVLRVFERRLMEKQIHAHTNFEEKSTMVEADPNMIHRVIHNLLDNAVKFTLEGGEITVETKLLKKEKKKEPKVLIAVKNTGHGISEEEQKKVFERFFKADSSRGLDKSGVGLGLSIVKEFVKAHGESVQVHSEKDKETAFTFTLKRVVEEKGNLW